MNFGVNLKAFLRELPLAKMSGHQKFLAVAALSSRGQVGVELAARGIESLWRKSLLKIKYNPSFYDRAQGEGWVDPIDGKKGVLTVTQTGLDHLAALPAPDTGINAGGLQRAGGLIVVNRKATHTFDKLLRTVFAQAKSRVLIADSWVDESIFDNVLDVIPKSVPVKLLYAQARGSFDQRATRFSTEYPGYAARKYKHLHDRFILADDDAYILGPSIKDAASSSPALVVKLAAEEGRLLLKFFNDLWAKATQPTSRI